MPPAQGAVEVFQQPLPAALEDLSGRIAPGIEVLAVHHPAGDWLTARPVRQLGIQSPLVRGLALQGGGGVVVDQGLKIGGQGLTVGRVVDGDIAHPVAGGLELAGEIAHGSEDGQHLLGVMAHIVRFLADLHQDMDRRRVGDVEPGMAGVELVTQDQAQDRSAPRHRLRWGARGRGGGCLAATRAGAKRGNGAGLSPGTGNRTSPRLSTGTGIEPGAGTVTGAGAGTVRHGTTGGEGWFYRYFRARSGRMTSQPARTSRNRIGDGYSVTSHGAIFTRQSTT